MGMSYCVLYLFSVFFIVLFPYDIAETPDQNAKQKLSRIWHSYELHSGAGNREGLHLSKSAVDHSFTSVKGVIKWNVLQMQEKIHIVGLGENFLTVITYAERNTSYVHNTGSNEHPTAVGLFQLWNETAQKMEGYAIVAVNMDHNESFLKWYKITNTELIHLWDWPVHRNITHLQITTINQDPKLLMISHSLSGEVNPSADIYSFVMHEDLDLWLFDRLALYEVPSSAVICNDGDNAFLLVALPKMESVHVYKYSLITGNNHFKLHQTIPSTSVTSLTTFRIGFRRYLAIASSTSSIYSFMGNQKLVPATKINFGNQKHWLAVPVNTYREDIMLMAESSQGISIVVGKGQGSFLNVSTLSDIVCENDNDDQCSREINALSLKGSAAFSQKGVYVLLSSKTKSTVLRLFVNLRSLPSKVEQEMRELLDAKTTIMEKMKHQALEIDKLKNVTGLLPRPDTDNEFHEKWEVTLLKTQEVSILAVNESKIGNIELAQNKNWTEEDSKINANSLESSVLSLSALIEDLKKNLHFEEGQQKATLPIYVNGGFSVAGKVYVDNLELLELNGHNVTTLLTDTFRQNRREKIKGTKVFTDAQATSITFGTLREIPAGDIMFGTKAQNKVGNLINGDVVFENDVVILGNLTLLPEGTVNQLRMVKDVFRTAYTYHDSLSFEELKITNEANIRDTINDLPLILPVRISPLDVHSLDNVNQARVERINVLNNLNVTNINGKNFKNLMNQVWLTTQNSLQKFPVQIQGTFSSSAVEVEYINGLKFPEDFITSTSKEPITISGEKTFIGSIVADCVDVEDKKLRETEKLRVHIFENLELEDLVITDSINNNSWSFLQNVVRKGDEDLLVLGSKNFTKEVFAETIELQGTMNDENIETILTNSGEQIILHPQTFQDVEFGNANVTGTWDDICFKCLNRTILRRSDNGTFESKLIFDNNTVVANELNVFETINENVTVRSVFVLGEDVVLNGDLLYKSVKAARVFVSGSLTTFGNINDVNLKDFEERRLSLIRPQKINNVSLDHLNINGNLTVKLINQNYISRSASDEDDDTLTKFLSGRINRLRNLTVKGDIRTKNGLNRIDLRKLKEQAIDITKPNNLVGNITFQHLVYFAKLNVTGFVNNIKLRRLHRDLVYKHHGNVLLKGTKNFFNGIAVGNLRTRTLNGHLVTDILSKSGEPVIKGPIQINGDVVVQGDVNLFGTIDGSALSDLQQWFSAQHNSYVVPGDLELEKGSVTVNHLILNGRINNVDFDNFMSDVTRKNEDFVVVGSKILADKVEFKKNLNLEGTLNDLNFSKFYHDVVQIDRPAKVEGGIVLKKAIINVLHVGNDFNSTLINNCDVSEWVEESIPTDQFVFVKGKKTFESVYSKQGVLVDFLNNHSFDSMIPLLGSQNIPVSVCFSKINATADVSVGGMVNDKVLENEYLDTVTTIGDQAIEGEVIFSENVVIDGDVTLDYVNGRAVNDLTTLHTEQTITSVVAFDGHVVVSRDIQDVHSINDISINDWSKRQISLKKDQTISGYWTVLGNVTAQKNITGDGLLDFKSLRNISRSITEKRNLSLQMQQDIEDDYRNKCQDLKRLSNEVANQPYLFHQFHMAGIWDVRKEVESVLVFQANGSEYLLTTFVSDCESVLYRWDKSKSAFIYWRQLFLLGPVSKWLVLNHNSTTYLITSAVDNSVFCEVGRKPGNVWTFEDNGNEFGHVLSTEPFVDIIQANDTSGTYYTIGINGEINEYILEGGSKIRNRLLLNVVPGRYKFLDFKVVDGLAVTNGSLINKIIIENGLPKTEPLTIGRIPHLHDGDVVATTVEEKNLVAVALEDKVVVYENIVQKKIFASIHARRPSSLLWLNYGSGREVFLIFKTGSQQKTIEVFQYKGVSGLRKRMSLYIPSARLQLATLFSKTELQPTNYLVVIYLKKVLFLEVQMFGNAYNGTNLSC